jgi:hypothetical protein
MKRLFVRLVDLSKNTAVLEIQYGEDANTLEIERSDSHFWSVLDGERYDQNGPATSAPEGTLLCQWAYGAVHFWRQGPESESGSGVLEPQFDTTMRRLRKGQEVLLPVPPLVSQDP